MRYTILTTGLLLAATPAMAETGIHSLMQGLDSRAGYEATLEMAWCKSQRCEIRSGPGTATLAECSGDAQPAALRWQRAHQEFAGHELAWVNCWTGERG
jgi:hypothetical protein